MNPPRHALRNWLRSFIPVRVGVNGTERLRACGGALLGILVTGLVMRWTLGPDIPVSLLIAPMGASAVLLFALPSSPLAQPWSIMGGNLVSASRVRYGFRIRSGPPLRQSL